MVRRLNVNWMQQSTTCQAQSPAGADFFAKLGKGRMRLKFSVFSLSLAALLATALCQPRALAAG